ncbi:MAG: copper chaperone [Calditrichaeota bacterium]|nr:MAG: copper chaperone [Calditrichota bacterium]
MEKAVFSVQGMTCQHCVMHVEKALKKLPGVQNYRVSLEEARADVEYDAGQVSREQIFKALQDTGYQISELEASQAG